MNCKARIIDNHGKINIESNLKKTCSSPKVVLPILPKKSQNVSGFTTTFTLWTNGGCCGIWTFTSTLGSSWQRGRKVYGKTRQITGISQKKTTTKPGITSTLKDKEKAFHATLFSFFFSCRAGFHQVNLSSFLGAFWTFLGYQPQRGGQPNKTKKNKHRLTSRFRRHQTIAQSGAQMC